MTVGFLDLNSAVMEHTGADREAKKVQNSIRNTDLNILILCFIKKDSQNNTFFCFLSFVYV